MADNSFGFVIHDGQTTNTMINDLTTCSGCIAERFVLADSINIEGEVDDMQGDIITVALDWEEGASSRVTDIAPDMTELAVGVDVGTSANSVVLSGVNNASTPLLSGNNSVWIRSSDGNDQGTHSTWLGFNIRRFQNGNQSNVIGANTLVGRGGSTDFIVIGNNNPQCRGAGRNMIIGNGNFCGRNNGMSNVFIGNTNSMPDSQVNFTTSIGNNVTNDTGGAYIGNNITSNRDQCVILSNTATPSNNNQIIIGNNSNPTPSVNGLLAFSNVESTLTGGPLAGTTPDAFIPISWNGNLIRLPAYI